MEQRLRHSKLLQVGGHDRVLGLIHKHFPIQECEDLCLQRA